MFPLSLSCKSNFSHILVWVKFHTRWWKMIIMWKYILLVCFSFEKNLELNAIIKRILCLHRNKRKYAMFHWKNFSRLKKLIMFSYINWFRIWIDKCLIGCRITNVAQRELDIFPFLEFLYPLHSNLLVVNLNLHS